MTTKDYTESDLILLSSNKNVIDLFEILKQPQHYENRNEFASIVEYTNLLEKQLSQVIGEMKSVKQQLDEIKDNQDPMKKACTKILQNLATQISKIKQKLNDVKKSISDFAKNTVKTFEEKGITALDSTMQFLKVKDDLTDIKDDFNKAALSAEKSLSKIENISTEYHEIGRHVKNMVRAFSGKEAINERKTNGLISDTIKSPINARKLRHETAEKNVTKLISKIEKLEQTAANIEKKPSIIKKIKASNVAAKSTAIADKAKKQEIV